MEKLSAMSISVFYDPNVGIYCRRGSGVFDMGGSELTNCRLISASYSGDLSGSHTALRDGTPAFTCGPNVTMSTGSNGSVQIGCFGYGNTLVVDNVNGNDSSGQIGFGPYKTVNAAVNAMRSGDTVWVMPGTYELNAPITLPTNSSIRGCSLQTTTLQMTNVTSSVSMITMGENCRVEDLTVNLTSNGHYALVGILFPGSTSVTSKLRTMVVTVNNAAADINGTSTVCGIRSTGSGTLGDGNFSFNSIKGSTVNVKSAGSGSKTGICIQGPNAFTIRDVNVYVSASAGSSGDFVGIRTTNSSAEAQVRTSSIFGRTADISQVSGTIIVGPGTDLMNRTADDRPFTTYIYPITLTYAVIGELASANTDQMYLPVGSGVAQPGFSTGGKTVYRYPPDYVVNYSLEQRAILLGLRVTSSVGPGAGTTNVYVMKNGQRTAFTGSLTDGILSCEYKESSLAFNKNDLLAVRVETTGSNATQNLACQVNLF